MGKTKAEVLAKMAELQDQARKGQITTGPDQTVGEWLNTWHSGLSASGRLKASTVRNYRNIIDFYIPDDVKRLRLTALTAEHVDRMTANLLKKTGEPASSSTRRLARIVLGAAMEQARRRGYVSENVVTLSFPVTAKTKENVPLTPDQAKAVLAHVSEDSSQWAAFYTLALHNGLREGELIALEWENVDLHHGMVTVASTFDPVDRITTNPKSASSARTISLTPEGIQALTIHRLEQELRGRQGSDGLVFTSRKGTPLYATTVRRHWSQTQAALGIGPIRFHDLRHSCATILLANKVPLEMVSEILGHSGIKITADVYNYIPVKATREAMVAISKALS
jgi:integrase